MFLYRSTVELSLFCEQIARTVSLTRTVFYRALIPVVQSVSGEFIQQDFGIGTWTDQPYFSQRCFGYRQMAQQSPVTQKPFRLRYSVGCHLRRHLVQQAAVPSQSRSQRGHQSIVIRSHVTVQSDGVGSIDCVSTSRFTSSRGFRSEWPPPKKVECACQRLADSVHGRWVTWAWICPCNSTEGIHSVVSSRWVYYHKSCSLQSSICYCICVRPFVLTNPPPYEPSSHTNSR